MYHGQSYALTVGWHKTCIVNTNFFGDVDLPSGASFSPNVKGNLSRDDEVIAKNVKPWPNGLASRRKFAKPELAYGLAKGGQAVNLCPNLSSTKVNASPRNAS